MVACTGVGNNHRVAAHVCTVAIVSPAEVVTSGVAGIVERHQDRLRLIDAAPGFGNDDPDVIVYDVVALHDGDGSDLEGLVKETTSAVLAISRDLRPDLGARALALGADGFVSLEISEDALIEALEAACRGESADDDNTVTGFDAHEHALGHDVGLTPREVDVLQLITQGLSNQEIAEQTYLSINSVKTYIRTAYRRVGVTSRSQAVVWCLQHGFAAEAD